MTSTNAGPESKQKMIVAAAILAVVLLFAAIALVKVFGTKTQAATSKGAVTGLPGGNNGENGVSPEQKAEFERKLREADRAKAVAAVAEGKNALPEIAEEKQPVPAPTARSQGGGLPGQPAQGQQGAGQGQGGQFAQQPANAQNQPAQGQDPVSLARRQEATKFVSAWMELSTRPKPAETSYAEQAKPTIQPGQPNGAVAAAGAGATGSNAAAANVAKGDASLKAPLIQAGASYKARLDTILDTDAPTPVFMEFLAPLEGASGVCSFTRVGNYINVKVNSMLYRGRNLKVNAVVMDFNTGRALLAGEVDEKWMARLGWPFVADVVAGIGNALSRPTQATVINSGTTVVTSDALDTKQILGAAVGRGADNAATVFKANAKENAARQVLIDPAKNPQNSVVVVRFLEPVYWDQGQGTNQ